MAGGRRRKSLIRRRHERIPRENDKPKPACDSQSRPWRRHLAALPPAMNPPLMSVSLEPAPPPRGEDLPCDDGEPMETQRHRDQMNVLVDSLADHYRSRHDVYVAGNMAVYFSETQTRRNDFRAPDVFVVLDTDDHERRSWVVWEEHGRTPDVVIELTSPTTEEVDRGPKVHIYERLLHVGTYVLYDPFTEALNGFQLVGSHYVPLALDERGRLPVAPLGLSLGVVCREGETRLRWFDAEGHVIPLAAEREAARADEAEQRAAEAERRAVEAQAEVARLKALLGR